MKLVQNLGLVTVLGPRPQVGRRLLMREAFG